MLRPLCNVDFPRKIILNVFFCTCKSGHSFTRGAEGVVCLLRTSCNLHLNVSKIKKLQLLLVKLDVFDAPVFVLLSL